MRSSESANKASHAISVRIRCRPGSKNTDASAPAARGGRQPLRRARSASAASTLLAGGAGEQALRTQDQNDDHDGVDDERPEFGDVILARDVGDADQQRGGERTGDA